MRRLTILFTIVATIFFVGCEVSVGPQGPEGSEGPQGPAGQQGIQGPSGQQGIHGPPWKDLIGLTPEANRKYQEFAREFAASDGIARVHLDALLWVKGK